MKMNLFIKFFSLTLLVITSLNIFAEEKVEEIKEKNWLTNINENLSLTLEGSLSSNFYKEDSTNHSYNSSLLVYPSYKISKNITGLLYLTFDKELKNYMEDDWGTSFIGASFKITKFGKNEMFKFKTATKAYLPLDEQNRKNYQMRTKLVIGPKLSADLSKVGVKGLTVRYAIDFGRYIHKYKTARSGSSLNRYSTTQKYIIDYSPIDPLALNATLLVTDRWSYSGKRQTSSYLFDLSAGYDLTDVYGVAIGYTNTAKAFKPDGTTNNVDLFNTDDSEFYLSLSAAF